MFNSVSIVSIKVQVKRSKRNAFNNVGIVSIKVQVKRSKRNTLVLLVLRYK